MICELIKKCEACGKEYYIPFRDILELGEAIKKSHDFYYCKKDFQVVSEPTIAEKLERLIIEIVDKNSNDYE